MRPVAAGAVAFLTLDAAVTRAREIERMLATAWFPLPNATTNGAFGSITAMSGTTRARRYGFGRVSPRGEAWWIARYDEGDRSELVAGVLGKPMSAVTMLGVAVRRLSHGLGQMTKNVFVFAIHRILG